MLRGFSVSNPFARVRWQANNWAGKMLTMGDTHSGIPAGRRIGLCASERACFSSEMTTNSADCSIRSRPSISSRVSNTFPEGVTAITGKPPSIMAMGPWRKSAEEYGSATT